MAKNIINITRKIIQKSFPFIDILIILFGLLLSREIFVSIQPYPAWDFQTIVFLQHTLGTLAPFFQWISIILAPPVFFVVAFMLYFLDHKKGVYSFIYLALAIVLALSLKDIFHHPRPFWTSPLITGYISPTDYGMPSAHALFSTYLIFLALMYKKIWGVLLAIVGVILVCLSRMVLGVHFMEQIIVGLLLGTICMVTAPAIYRLLHSRKLNPRGIFTLLLVALLVILVFITSLYIQWGMYFEPLKEWNMLLSRTSPKTIHRISIFWLAFSFLFCFGTLLALFLEETILRVQRVIWSSINFRNILFLSLIVGTYLFATAFIFFLIAIFSLPLALCMLAFWIPFFSCYCLPLELAILKLIALEDIPEKKRYSGLATYLHRSYEK